MNKKKLKKILAVGMALALMAGLAACGGEVADGATDVTTQAGIDEPGDVSAAGSLALHVEGTTLKNAAGQPVQLRGFSTHGLAWFPQYVNRDLFGQLKSDFGANVVRLAMYTSEYGGYCSGGDREQLKQLVRDGVEYATELGMYVIVDWHILSDGNPATYQADAKDFLGQMSREFADHDNVIYEICNEPNGGTTWAQIKAYAEDVIPVIRQNTDALILVGTPNWSQFVGDAAADPIKGQENIMYTLHFYAATHKDDLRNAMTSALDAGLPIFVSEFGICDASGNGGIDRDSASAWLKLMNDRGVSYVAWNLSNKAETSAIFRSDCQKTSGFGEGDYSESGLWLKEMYNK